MELKLCAVVEVLMPVMPVMPVAVGPVPEPAAGWGAADVPPAPDPWAAPVGLPVAVVVPEVHAASNDAAATSATPQVRSRCLLMRFSLSVAPLIRRRPTGRLQVRCRPAAG